MHKGYTTPLVIAIMAFAIVSFLFLIDTAIMPANSNQTTNRTANKNVDDVACTLEAKICPDGSAVGRSGPTCEFAECPETNTNSSSNTNSREISNYFQISEWGVEFPTTVKYVYSKRSDVEAIYFSTEALQVDCPADEGPLGAISRSATIFLEGPLSTQTPIKIQNWYYYYSTAQATCSGNSQINNQQTEGTSDLREDFKQLRQIDTTNLSAGWKTYTNDAEKYSLKYPAVWTYKEVTDLNEVQFTKTGDSNIIQPSVRVRTGVTLEDIKQDLINNLATIREPLSRSIGGYKATGFSYMGAIGADYDLYLLSKESKSFVFFSSKDEVEWEQALDTFTFTN